MNQPTSRRYPVRPYWFDVFERFPYRFRRHCADRIIAQAEAIGPKNNRLRDLAPTETGGIYIFGSRNASLRDATTTDVVGQDGILLDAANNARPSDARVSNVQVNGQPYP